MTEGRVRDGKERGEGGRSNPGARDYVVSCMQKAKGCGSASARWPIPRVQGYPRSLCPKTLAINLLLLPAEREREREGESLANGQAIGGTDRTTEP